nr:zinc finger protein chinmo isoform X2 [Neodiprion pinetum]
MPLAGGAVGHGQDQEERSSLLEGGCSDRGGGESQGGGGPRGGVMDSNQQQFCLKWNSFGSNLATAFSNLFKSESLTDVTLFCEGVTFKAHRLILAACSKHFQELFEGMPPSPAGLIVILDGTSAHNMTALLEFMYRGEVHVSQESLSSFLKAAECLQVKGLSIEHEKLAVAQRHAAEGNSSSDGNGGIGGGGSGAGAGNTGIGAAGSVRKKSPTPVPAPSNATNYSVPTSHATTQHYYDSPRKRLMRSPSDADALGRASVLRDGAAFRPASAPHPLLLDSNLHSHFPHPTDQPSHPHTAPHTPTELERELERDRSEERGNGEHRDNGAEDLRIKQEPGLLTDRERAERLAERSSGESYGGRGGGGESAAYSTQGDHLGQHQGCGNLAPIPPPHPPTPDLSPAPATPATWNSKINKAGTVTTPDGKKLKCPFCERLYGYETNLRAHIRQRHQGIRVPCPFCSRTFTRNNTVRRHIAREHKTELSLKAYQQSNAATQ